MEFSDKCAILAYVYIWERENPNLGTFTFTYDIGLPLAYFLDRGDVILNPESAPELIADIERAYDALVATLGIDPYGEYASFDEMQDIAAG